MKFDISAHNLAGPTSSAGRERELFYTSNYPCVVTGGTVPSKINNSCNISIFFLYFIFTML
uniref:Uncharacterized protein n=1 Tax=Arundo donax TaxID=35708 RepID=A0A0A9GW20_ARUDO